MLMVDCEVTEKTQFALSVLLTCERSGNTGDWRVWLYLQISIGSHYIRAHTNVAIVVIKLGG